MSRPAMSMLTAKGGVVALALAGALVLVASASRTWVSGTVDDAVLGASRVSGTGSQLAPGLVAIALAGAAAALVATTSGRLVRRLSIVVLGVAALGAGGLVAAVLADPAGRLGGMAARSTGRTGSVETHASTGAWPWLALAGAALLLTAAVAAWLGAGRWRGLSERYETPVGAATEVAVRGAAKRGSVAEARAGARGQRVASAWESLDAGVDPTEPAAEPPGPASEQPGPTSEPPAPASEPPGPASEPPAPASEPSARAQLAPELSRPAELAPPLPVPGEVGSAEADPAEAGSAEADPAEAGSAEADPAEADPAEADTNEPDSAEPAAPVERQSPDR